MRFIDTILTFVMEISRSIEESATCLECKPSTTLLRVMINLWRGVLFGNIGSKYWTKGLDRLCYV